MTTDPEKAAQEVRAAHRAAVNRLVRACTSIVAGEYEAARDQERMMADAYARLAVIAGQVRLLDRIEDWCEREDQPEDEDDLAKLVGKLRVVVLRGDHAEGGEGHVAVQEEG